MKHLYQWNLKSKLYSDLTEGSLSPKRNRAKTEPRQNSNKDKVKSSHYIHYLFDTNMGKVSRKRPFDGGAEVDEISLLLSDSVNGLKNMNDNLKKLIEKEEAEQQRLLENLGRLISKKSQLTSHNLAPKKNTKGRSSRREQNK